VTRKSLLLSVLLLVLLAAGGLGGLYLLLRHEPGFYSHAEIPPGPERQTHSREYVSETTRFITEKVNCETDWQLNFTQDQINSWLAEDFVTSNTAETFLPAGVTDPRVVLEPGRIVLAFRYGEEDFNTVISVHAKVWLPKKERSTIAVEIESLRAGMIPVSWKLLQEQLTEGARQQHMDLQWYRNDGNPVAILRFQSDKREPTIQLQKLRIEQGRIHIEGRSLDPETRKFTAALGLLATPAAE
jgi:hypothetical protein